MLIYGCEEPGSADDLAWSCGEMHSELDGDVAHRPPCRFESSDLNDLSHLINQIDLQVQVADHLRVGQGRAPAGAARGCRFQGGRGLGHQVPRPPGQQR